MNMNRFFSILSIVSLFSISLISTLTLIFFLVPSLGLLYRSFLISEIIHLTQISEIIHLTHFKYRQDHKDSHTS